MKKNSRATERLNSWKGIAAYLECDVRTCRRWEITKKLPVHRFGESEKARVFAYTHELDRWLKIQVRKNNGPGPLFSRRSQNRLTSISASCLLVGVAGFTIISHLSRDRNPDNFRIERSILTITNREGRRLWEYDTGLENLVPDNRYQVNAQYKKRIANYVEFPMIIIDDLQGDGRNEVLFSLQTQNEKNEGLLICFDHRGNVTWSFQGGRELRFGPKVYSGDYRIKGFILADINRDAVKEVIVLSVHSPDWPCQLAVLDSRGRRMAEYWNAGYIMDLAFQDLDGDGDDEMLLCGISNEYGRGFFAVLDPMHITGQSPHTNATYSSPELKKGTHLHYLLFPRTEIRKEHPTEAVLSIDLLKNGRISLTTEFGGLIYELNPDLSIQHVTLSNTFKEMHAKANLAGDVVVSELDDAYRRRLREGVLYFDGDEWVAAHPMR